MSKLKELIHSLKAYTVIIVENNFRHITDAEEIVARFIQLPVASRNNITEELKTIALDNLSAHLSQFDESFCILPISEADYKNLLPKNFRQYLTNIEQEALLTEALITAINEELEKEGSDVFKDMLLLNGIGSIAGANEEAIYNKVLSELNEIPEISISYYRDYIGEDARDKFTDRLASNMKSTNSLYYLAIIDKHLGDGNVDLNGKVLIEKTLIEIRKDHNLKFVGFILTAKVEDTDPISYDDYFVREISKNEEELITLMVDRIAQAAYITVFSYLSENYKQSSEEVRQVVIKNQKNIKHIVEQSHIEGIPAFDAIKQWFDMAIDMYNSKSEINDFSFIGGLTAFFNDHYLSDNPEIASIGEEIKEIRSFELFDYSINKRYLPIAPGDIWLINGNYYILVGQLCDILLRENTNKRNSKIAEFLPIKLHLPKEEDGVKKYYVKTGKSKRIFIENFIDSSGENMTMAIGVSTPEIYTSDFNLLDLAMFNNEGDCKIEINSKLSREITNVLPAGKEKLHEHLSEIINNIPEAHRSEYSDLSPINLNLFDFVKDGNVVSYNAKRMARLRGRYYDSLYNNYINVKSRVDLNLVDNSPEIPYSVELDCQFAGQETTKISIQNAVLWKKLGNEYFKTTELLELLPDPFKELISECEELIRISESKRINCEELEPNKYNIYSPLLVKIE